jgi:hypothetical protein
MEGSSKERKEQMENSSTCAFEVPEAIFMCTLRHAFCPLPNTRGRTQNTYPVTSLI